MKYQKAILDTYLLRVPTTSAQAPSDDSFGSRVARWAADRNLVRGSCPLFQMDKLREESEELEEAIETLHGPAHEPFDEAGFKDAIGDIQVVLAVMCAQLGISIDECRELAWNEIKDRKGQMIDGVFVKEQDLRSY